ncbi:Cytochrome b561/ferric reductase transmembrane - like 9 [Theobroma cacao]|uniref:Cytochrome b561 and DOMON domain-containing protein At5g35735 n=1 Tax=Theobroma cacao TaxID=3641 RepID=A0AB32V2E3_THECC|nr:PREDICTED: cytochrome b561 and DOMON domain-containing protein At5g35735 [Theobroma cacao]WRX26256.1 Cytochrome b561/ferric reductase transmembrane - like 9 [Theobroma cacao]
MTFYCLVFLSLIFPLPSISAQVSVCNEELSFATLVGKNQEWQVDRTLSDMEHQIQAASVQSTETGATAGLRPWKGQRTWRHRHHLKNVHGILNILGWGFLLPTGAIIARNFRKFPLKCNEWYNLYVLCQSSGYIVGTVGWGIGLWLGNSSKQYTLKTHRILGIIIFTFATLQMSALWLQPKAEDECRKCWEIYHHLLGYALIVLSIANIFQGISNVKSHAAEKWRWVYVGMLIVLASTAVALEIYRWIKSKSPQQMAFDENEIYASEQI